MWSQRLVRTHLTSLFFSLFVFKWVPLLGGGLRIRKCYQDSPISHERIFGLDTKLWEMAPTHNGLFPQKRPLIFFFTVALPIFGMNKKCWFFFNSFVIWRCKDDCNKVITSHYFFCVFVNRFFQQKSFSFQFHTVMYEIHLISGSFLGWNSWPFYGRQAHSAEHRCIAY